MMPVYMQPPDNSGPAGPGHTKFFDGVRHPNALNNGVV